LEWSNELLQKLGLDVNATNSNLAGQHMALAGQLNGGVWNDTTWEDVVATALVLWYCQTQRMAGAWQLDVAKANDWMTFTMSAMNDYERQILKRIMEMVVAPALAFL
jgi:hypothetical protein